MSNKVFLVFLIIAALIVIALVAWTGQKTAIQQVSLSNNAATTNKTTDNNLNTTNSVVEPAVKEDIVKAPVTTSDYTLLADVEANVIGEITTYIFIESNILNVMPATMQAAVLNETPVKERMTIMIGDTAAERLTINSAKDGSNITVVQAVVGETLYDFRGSDDFLSNLSKYIEFSN